VRPPSLYGQGHVTAMGISVICQKLVLDSGLKMLNPNCSLPPAPGSMHSWEIPDDRYRHYCVRELQIYHALVMDVEVYCRTSNAYVRSASRFEPHWFEFVCSCGGINLPTGEYVAPSAIMIACAAVQNSHFKAFRTANDKTLGNVEAFRFRGGVVLDQETGYTDRHHLCVVRDSGNSIL
jgi:hypothetical protein